VGCNHFRKGVQGCRLWALWRTRIGAICSLGNFLTQGPRDPPRVPSREASQRGDLVRVALLFTTAPDGCSSSNTLAPKLRSTEKARANVSRSLKEPLGSTPQSRTPGLKPIICLSSLCNHLPPRPLLQAPLPCRAYPMTYPTLFSSFHVHKNAH
jgi:hypothetical protein